MAEYKKIYDINLDDQKIQRRLVRLCREKVRDLFEEGQYNY